MANATPGYLFVLDQHSIAKCIGNNLKHDENILIPIAWLSVKYLVDLNLPWLVGPACTFSFLGLPLFLTLRWPALTEVPFSVVDELSFLGLPRFLGNISRHDPTESNFTLVGISDEMLSVLHDDDWAIS